MDGVAEAAEWSDGQCADHDLIVCCSIHLVHDEAKDKDFELELSWISPASAYKHKTVPKDLADKAEARAKEIIDEANQMED